MLGELGLTELLSSLNPLPLLYLQAYIIKLLALREKCPDTEFFRVRIFLCQSLFFNKVAGLACNLIIKQALAQENTDPKNSVFGHFLRSVGYTFVSSFISYL